METQQDKTKIKEGNIDNLFKKCSLIFQDVGEAGLKVSLIYVEKIQKNIIFSNTYEAVLTSFIIDTQSLLELRRRKSTKTTITFGNTTFNIFELVNFLNELCSSVTIPDA